MAGQGFVNYSKAWGHFFLPGAGGQAYDFPDPGTAPSIPDHQDRP
ncbi:hypothetical protein [Bradyrhizobium sp.]